MDAHAEQRGVSRSEAVRR
ncbi:hypothetical protein [Reyranella soli]